MQEQTYRVIRIFQLVLAAIKIEMLPYKAQWRSVRQHLLKV